MIFWCQHPLFHHKTQLHSCKKQGQTAVPRGVCGPSRVTKHPQTLSGKSPSEDYTCPVVLHEKQRIFSLRRDLGAAMPSWLCVTWQTLGLVGHPHNGSRLWPLPQWNRSNQVLLQDPWAVISFLSTIYSFSFFLYLLLECFLFYIFICLLKRTNMITYFFCTAFKLF